MPDRPTDDPTHSLVPSATGIRRAAMDWLARREHSRRELEQRLRRLFPDATAAIGPALDQLEREGLLSDRRFAESFTRSRTNRGFGPRRIARELRARGVEQHSVGAAQDGDETADCTDWLARARDLRARRYGDYAAEPAERAKQMRFLERRGFPVAICRKACIPPRAGD